MVSSETDLYVEAALHFLRGKSRGIDARLGQTDGSTLTLKPHDPVVVADIQREREKSRKPLLPALRRAS